MKLRTPITLAATLALTFTLSLANAQAQPPQCAYFLFTAQDFAFINNAEYSNNLSELFTLTPNWDDQDVCAGFELSNEAPATLNSIGNNRIQADANTFTAYVWNSEAAWRVTPLAVEPYATADAPIGTIADLPIVIDTQPTETTYPNEDTYPNPNDEFPHANYEETPVTTEELIPEAEIVENTPVDDSAFPDEPEPEVLAYEDPAPEEYEEPNYPDVVTIEEPVYADPIEDFPHTEEEPAAIEIVTIEEPVYADPIEDFPHATAEPDTTDEANLPEVDFADTPVEDPHDDTVVTESPSPIEEHHEAAEPDTATHEEPIPAEPVTDLNLETEEPIATSELPSQPISDAAGADNAITDEEHNEPLEEPIAEAPAAPEPIPAADVTLEAAWEQLELGNYSTAALYFTRLTQEDINNISAHDGLSRARYAQGALTSAATTLEIAISIDPTNYTIAANLGNILIQTGQYDKAITILEGALELGTSNPEHLAQAHANLALAYERTNQPDQAAEQYAEAFNLDPNPTYKTREFHALNASGQTTSLIPQLLTHTQEHPSTDLHLLAAQIYHSLGDHPSRDHQVQLALETAETEDEKARALTYQATTNTDTTTAINQYQEAAELSPNQWEAHYNAGILSLNNNDPSNAVTHLQKASELTNRLDIQAALARAYLNDHNPSSALHYAQNALTSESDDIRQHAAETAIHAAYQLGDYAAVAQLEPQFGSHNNPDTLTLLGTSNYNLGNYSTAALQLQAAYNLRPTAGLKHTLAYAYLAAYQAINALPLLQELVNEAPMDGQLQHALGWAHQMTGNTIDSQLAFRRATALGYQ